MVKSMMTEDDRELLRLVINVRSTDDVQEGKWMMLCSVKSAAFPYFRRAASHRLGPPPLPISCRFTISTFSLFSHLIYFDQNLPGGRFPSGKISLSAEIGFTTTRSSSVGGGWVWQGQAVSSINHQPSIEELTLTLKRETTSQYYLSLRSVDSL